MTEFPFLVKSEKLSKYSSFPTTVYRFFEVISGSSFRSALFSNPEWSTVIGLECMTSSFSQLQTISKKQDPDPRQKDEKKISTVKDKGT